MKTRAQSRLPHHLAVFSLLFIVASPSVELRAQSCGNQTPAFPVPENLWLKGIFRPGLSDLPGNQIPADRDSTAWDSLGTVPGFTSGFEIFESLDIAGDYLYAAYNAGFSVWNIAGSNAEDPERIAVRDGWYFFDCQESPICGPFLSFPAAGETDFLIEDIVVLPVGSLHYIALSGRGPVGMSLWVFDTVTGDLTATYQDTTRLSRQVRLVAIESARGASTVYAFSSSSTGLAVYDFSRARAISPCLEEADSDCPEVYRGNLGSITDGRYLDLLKRSTGEILVATTNGNQTGQGLELWEVADPANPGAASPLFSGLDERTYGTALFNYEGNDYLAALERDGAFNVIKIFNISACRGGPCSLGAPVFDDIGVPPRISNQFLTYSTSNGTPFLYYGLFGGLSGPKVEQLLNLTTLGRPGQNIIEMTDGGPTYFDTCRNEDLGYWAWYYPGNEFGLKNLTPQVGKFGADSPFFYRAARGLLDVHVWEAVPVPATTTTVSSPDPLGLYWMGDEVTFEGAGTNGCNPAGIWTWTATTPASINAVTVAEIGDQVTYRFECTTRGGRCDDAMVSVSGINSDASCSGADTLAATITVKDPTLEITAINPSGGMFTQCNNVELAAELVGRGPVMLGWNVRRDPALDPMQNPQQTFDETVTDEDLSTSTPAFTWDTAIASFATIFADGFETGDVSAWGGAPALAEDFVVAVEQNPDGPSVSVTVNLSSCPARAGKELATTAVEW